MARPRTSGIVRFNSSPSEAPTAAPGELVELDQTNFHDYLAAQGDMVVVVDFYTSWCGPCKMMDPALVELAAARPDIRVVKVKCQKKNKELGQALNIKVAPTFLLYRRSIKVGEVMGARMDELVALIDDACAAGATSSLDSA